MLERILVALSGSPFTPSAVRHAIDLAERHDASITGVTVMNLAELANVGPVPIGGGAAAASLTHQRIELTRERIERTVADFERACGQAGVPHRVEQETGSALDLIMRLWRIHDLMVFGLRALFEYGIVHHPDDQLLRMSRAGVRPVLAVAETPRPIRSALLAYNGSRESAEAMKRFAQTNPWGLESIEIACFRGGKGDQDELVEEAAAYCRDHGLAAEPHVVDASARERLVPFAQERKVDLIVMGATTRSRLAEFLLGDTVLKAIRTSPLPLYIDS